MKKIVIILSGILALLIIVAVSFHVGQCNRQQTERNESEECRNTETTRNENEPGNSSTIEHTETTLTIEKDEETITTEETVGTTCDSNEDLDEKESPKPTVDDSKNPTQSPSPQEPAKENTEEPEKNTEDAEEEVEDENSKYEF